MTPYYKLSTDGIRLISPASFFTLLPLGIPAFPTNLRNPINPQITHAFGSQTHPHTYTYLYLPTPRYILKITAQTHALHVYMYFHHITDQHDQSDRFDAALCTCAASARGLFSERIIARARARVCFSNIHLSSLPRRGTIGEHGVL